MEEAFHVGVGFGVAVFENGGSRQIVHSRSALLTLIDFEIGLFDVGIVLNSLTDVFDGAAQCSGRFFLSREFDGTDDKRDVFVLHRPLRKARDFCIHHGNRWLRQFHRKSGLREVVCLP